MKAEAEEEAEAAFQKIVEVEVEAILTKMVEAEMEAESVIFQTGLLEEEAEAV